MPSALTRISRNSPTRVLSRILQWATMPADDRPAWINADEAELQRMAQTIREWVAEDYSSRRIVTYDGRPYVANLAGACTQCGHMPYRCTCVICRDCWEHGTPSLHRVCTGGCDAELCHEDCSCEPEYDDAESTPSYIRRGLAYRGAKDGIAPRRYVGLELEVTSWTDPYEVEHAASRVHASIVEDGSIGAGVELVTQPTRGAQLAKDLNTLLNDVTEANDKCGLHVHVDARDLGPWELRRVALLYRALEPALHKLYPEREGGSYCKRVARWVSCLVPRPKSTTHLRSTLWAMLYPGDVGESIKLAKTEKYRPTRYYALNLHSWCMRRTIEFRLAAGTDSPMVALEWAILCAGIVDFAVAHTDAQAETWDGANAGALLTEVKRCADKGRTWEAFP